MAYQAYSKKVGGAGRSHDCCVVISNMATTNASEGYQCQFLESAPEDHYCRRCSLVARKLAITSCCGESYCESCVHSLQQAKKACLGCGEEEFETFAHAKLQKKILSLQVYCPLNEKGCRWCDRLEQLDVHLDSDKGDCEYADVHCPLKCGCMITRMDVSHHIANECMKREFICPYCSFKGIYEVVFTQHWPDCSYYPLRCRNSCGVTCERQYMTDHMKMCPLERIDCRFSHFGCTETFKRENEEEHMKPNVQAHLNLATESLKRKQVAQEQLLEQLLEQERKFEKKLAVQERKFEKKLAVQERKFALQERKFALQERNFEEKLTLQKQYFQEFLKSLCPALGYKFELENLSVLKTRQKFRDQMSPAMYTHLHGYKFCVGIDVNGYGVTRRNTMIIRLWFMKGEYDDILTWPVTARFTLELINHSNECNKVATTTTTWGKPDGEYIRSDDQTGRFVTSDYCFFISHSELSKESATYVKGDTLNFIISDISVLD